MPEQSPVGPAGSSRGKIKLIILLAVVFIGVLAKNRWDASQRRSCPLAEKNSAPAGAPRRSEPVPPSRVVATPPGGPLSTATSSPFVAAIGPRKPLPPVDLTALLENDPFQAKSTPKPAPKAGDNEPSPPTTPVVTSEVRNERRAARATAPKVSQELRVSAVVSGNGAPLALVGKRFVRVGDQLDGGLRVVAIRSGSVVVETDQDE